MNTDMIEKLLEDILEESYSGLPILAIAGRTADMLQFVAALRSNLGYQGDVELFATDPQAASGVTCVRPCSAIADMRSKVLAIVEDDDKESVLSIAREFLPDAGARVLVAGYGHYVFRDQRYQAILDSLLAPSIANGYPNCLIHIYQCLENAAKLNLEGCVAEFGVFKGGTTRFIAEVVGALGKSWPIYGFDTFQGFPPRRSLLDMYDHPGAEYSRFSMVSQYLSDTSVELVEGDIVETASVLRDKQMLLTFVDTDNYSAAHAALSSVIENTVVGGVIVLDHFTGESRFRYTLGERMAANELLVTDPRYFNLHGTGVFMRCTL